MNGIDYNKCMSLAVICYYKISQLDKKEHYGLTERVVDTKKFSDVKVELLSGEELIGDVMINNFTNILNPAVNV
ncbi:MULTISPECIES: hypothetical protein [Bacillus]|uniref:hypothetical protein n=1 Tax=Bacillus TaxID=1386 RepID=UPI0011452CCD|nr:MULTISPECIES: hypothetical protein [Bacillus]